VSPRKALVSPASASARAAGPALCAATALVLACVTLNGRNQIRYEIRSPLQLDIDVRPRVLSAHTERDEPIVETNRCENENNDDYEDND
jgi:hypothetical protein